MPRVATSESSAVGIVKKKKKQYEKYNLLCFLVSFSHSLNENMNDTYDVTYSDRPPIPVN